MELVSRRLLPQGVGEYLVLDLFQPQPLDDDLLTLAHFAGELGVLLAAHVIGQHVVLGQGIDGGLVLQRLFEGIVQLFDHLGWCALGGHQAVGGGLDDIDAQFLQRGHIGEAFHALFAPDIQQLGLARFHIGHKGAAVGRGHHMATQQGLGQIGAAFERHMGQLDTCCFGNALHGQVRAG